MLPGANILKSLAPRVVAWLLLAIGVLKILVAWEAEQKGLVYTRGGRRSLPKLVKRVDNPDEFRNLMTARCLEAMFWVAGGMTIRGFVRRQERLDPMSPSFQGQKALDDLGKWLDNENDKHHRPLR
jgi:hypothetical protein